MEIIIQETATRLYSFALPATSDGFLEEFRTEIREPFRRWNQERNCWQIRPLNRAMLEKIAKLLERHFPGFTARILHAVEIDWEVGRIAEALAKHFPDFSVVVLEPLREVTK